MRQGDLVSVVIITYNSEKYIIEALNSVFEQDYKNIELVISDDASQDNTVGVIKEWLKDKQERFTNSVIIEAKENRGTSQNVNVGFENAKGKWIKLLAGDDVLFKTCISDNVKFVVENKSNSVVYSELLMFKDKQGKRIYKDQSREETEFCKRLCRESSDEQYRILLKRDMMVTASLFINRNMFFSIGKCDNLIPLIEDWPLRLKITQNGYRIYYMEKKTVYHRHEDSVTRKEECFFHLRHLNNLRKLKKHYCYSVIKPYHIIYYIEELLQLLEEEIIINMFHNKKNFFTICIANFFSVLMPRNWKKIYFKLIKNS